MRFERGVLCRSTGWPALILAVAMAGLFVASPMQIIRQALDERFGTVEAQNLAD